MAMSPGKKSLLITTAGLVVVLVLVAVFWRELVVAYHVRVLHGDPELMTTWITESGDSVKGRALRDYLRTRGGSLSLRRRLVADLFRLFETLGRDFLPEALREGRIVQGGIYELAGAHWLLFDGPSTLATQVPATADLLALEPLFELVPDGDFELAEYPGVRFTTWAYREELPDRPVVVELRMARPPAKR